MKGESETLKIYIKLIDDGLEHDEIMFRLQEMFGELPLDVIEAIEEEKTWNQYFQKIESQKTLD